MEFSEKRENPETQKGKSDKRDKSPPRSFSIEKRAKRIKRAIGGEINMRP